MSHWRVFSIASAFVICAAIVTTFANQTFWPGTIVLDIVAYIAIPGLQLSSIMNRPSLKLSGLSLALGFVFQLMMIFVSWMIYSFTGLTNVFAVMTLGTLLLLLLSYSRVRKQNTDKHSSKINQHLLVVFLLICTVVFILSASSVVQPTSDGALYLSTARNVATSNVFRSNMIVPGTDWTNVGLITGAQPHMFGYFSIALFFLFGGATLSSAQAMLVFGNLVFQKRLYAVTRIFYIFVM